MCIEYMPALLQFFSKFYVSVNFSVENYGMRILTILHGLSAIGQVDYGQPRMTKDDMFFSGKAALIRPSI